MSREGNNNKSPATRLAVRGLLRKDSIFWVGAPDIELLPWAPSPRQL